MSPARPTWLLHCVEVPRTLFTAVTSHGNNVAIAACDMASHTPPLPPPLAFLLPRLEQTARPCSIHTRPVDALLRTDTGSWCVRKSRPLLQPLIVMIAPLQASLLVAFSALKVALKGVLMGTHAVYQEAVVNN